MDYEGNTWVATRASRLDPFGEPEYFHPGLGFVTEDGLTHLFSLGPVGASVVGVPNYGMDDIYMRTRGSTTEDFGPAMSLGTPLNSSGLDCCVALGISDSTLYFTSTRPGAPAANGLWGFVNMWQAPVAEAVSLDVNPGGDSDPIDWNTQSVLSAAILSTEAFDALGVDVATLLFGDPLLIADGAAPVSPVGTGAADVNGDGRPDLTLEFSVAAMRGNGVIGLMTEQGYVAGKMLDGTVIVGRDALAFIPEPSSLLLILVGSLALIIRRRS